ncbi:MAG: glycosyl hydrolase family 18 protein [Niabella sp.]
MKNYIIRIFIISAVIFLIDGCSKKDAPAPTPSPTPGCTVNRLPQSNIVVNNRSVKLSWSKTTNASKYDVYIDTVPNPTKLGAENVTDTSYSYTLPYSEKHNYYWYVVPKNQSGTKGCASSITAFKYGTIPTGTTNISPATGATTAGGTIEFKWAKVFDATAYDLYFGTTKENATKVAADINDTTYSYTASAITQTTTCYWYVIPKNNLGAATGAMATATAFSRLFIKNPNPLSFSIISYFPSYRTVAEYPNSMFKMCDVMIYAFAGVNGSGTITINNVANFDLLYQKAKANGSKVFISVNDATNFKTAVATEAGRTRLAKDIMVKVRQYQLDGVDIDWEYPKTSDGTDVTFAAFMKELSDSLHVDGKYYLSAAITPGIYAGSIRDGIKTELFDYVDLFNVMAYDDFTTDPAYPYKNHSSMATANTSLNYWLNTRAMPKEKLILGIPAYGRNSGASQITASYKTILQSGTQLGPVPIYQSDSARLTTGGGVTYTTYYNGTITTAAKTTAAQSRCNGVFFWEMGHDANDQYSIIKAAADAIGKSY